MTPELIIELPLSGFVDTLIYFFMICLSTATVMWFLWEVTVKDKDYIENSTVALEKGNEIKHRRVHEQ